MEYARLQAFQQQLNFKLARLQMRKHLLKKRNVHHKDSTHQLEKFQQFCVDEREISNQIRRTKFRLHRLKRRSHQIKNSDTVYSLNIGISIVILAFSL